MNHWLQESDFYFDWPAFCFSANVRYKCVAWLPSYHCKSQSEGPRTSTSSFGMGKRKTFPTCFCCLHLSVVVAQPQSHWLFHQHLLVCWWMVPCSWALDIIVNSSEARSSWSHIVPFPFQWSAWQLRKMYLTVGHSHTFWGWLIFVVTETFPPAHHLSLADLVPI